MSTKHHLSQTEAIRALCDRGGWAIRWGDLDWRWTDDRGVAVDLVLPLTGENREEAEWFVTWGSLIW